jgi:hypothetical protein
MTDTSTYPEWLGPRLIDDAFPWADGVSTSLIEFFENYTLHDSFWIGLHLPLDQKSAAVALIRFDALWTDGRVHHPGSLVAEWPILLIRFSNVSVVRLAEFGKTHGFLRTIGVAVTEATSSGQHLTRFDDVVSGRVEVEHAPRVTILCLDRSGRNVPLPFRRAG